MQRVDKTPVQPEQVDVRDRVAVDGPFAGPKALVGEDEYFAPAVVAGAASRVDRRGDERHPGDDARLALDVAVLRQQIRLGIAARQVPQRRGDLGQWPAV